MPSLPKSSIPPAGALEMGLPLAATRGGMASERNPMDISGQPVLRACTSMRYALLVLGMWLLAVALIAVTVSTATVLWMPDSVLGA
jgi:hypothetical protein